MSPSYIISAHYSRPACGQELSVGVDPVPARYKEMHSSQASRHAYSRAGLDLYLHDGAADDLAFISNPPQPSLLILLTGRHHDDPHFYTTYFVDSLYHKC